MKMIYVLVGALAAAAVIGGVKSMAPSAPPAAPEPPVVLAAPPSPAPRQAGGETAQAVIEGEVLEIIDVQNYSYLRLGEKGTEGQWTAVPTSGLAVGARARVIDAMQMKSFKSAALGRSFPVIWFGVLEGAPRAAPNGAVQAAPHGGDPHAAGLGDPHAAAGAGDPHAVAGDPHGAAGAGDPAAAGAGDVKPVPRASGPNGKTVAEVIAQRTALAGKTVRIRGTVVKVTAGVLGKTYLHLRDGSGDAASGTNDITVTTEATPAPRDVIVVEGVVAIDRDIGSGYTFPTLVEQAQIIRE